MIFIPYHYHLHIQHTQRPAEQETGASGAAALVQSEGNTESHLDGCYQGRGLFATPAQRALYTESKGNATTQAYHTR